MKITPKRIIKAAVPYGALVVYRHMKNNREERSLYQQRFAESIASAKTLKHKKNPKIVISLTSYGDRIETTAPFAIASLLRQSVQPDKIVLWLAEGETPSKAIRELEEFGLEIAYTKDIKSYKKLIPALSRYPKATIITVDDDIVYPETWLETTLDAHKKYPRSIIANRARRITVQSGKVLPYNEWPVLAKNIKNSHVIMPTGAAGVLYPKDSLNKEVFNEDVFMKLAPHGDDLWFWAMSELAGTKRVVLENGLHNIFDYELDQHTGLSATVNSGDNNDIQFLDILNNFPKLQKNIGYKAGKAQFPGSAKYWEERYAEGGNSGAGSYDRLAQFKAEVLNKFVKEHNVYRVIEFGTGDGNQLLFAEYPEYVGLDVSKTAIEMCREMFKGDKTKQFYLLNKFDGKAGELTMSLDVLYHLVEQKIFEKHIKDLFKYSTKYVIIYAHDGDDFKTADHVLSRNFTKYINENIKGWKLTKHIPNKYPYDPNNETDTTWADFYIYERL